MRLLIWFGVLFSVVGTGMAIGALSILSADRELAAEGLRAQGTVIDLEFHSKNDGGGTYRPVVEFVDEDGDRQLYRSPSGSNPAAYERGEIVEIIYLADSPEQAMIDSFSDRWLLPLGLGVLALALGGAGYAALFFGIRRYKQIQWLKAHGSEIQADFVRCWCDTSIRLGNARPWRVEVEGLHPATGQTIKFVSDQVRRNLDRELEGKQVRVLVNPSKSDEHYVDLSRYLR